MTFRPCTELSTVDAERIAYANGDTASASILARLADAEAATAEGLHERIEDAICELETINSRSTKGDMSCAVSDALACLRGFE